MFDLHRTTNKHREGIIRSAVCSAMSKCVRWVKHTGPIPASQKHCRVYEAFASDCRLTCLNRVRWGQGCWLPTIPLSPPRFTHAPTTHRPLGGRRLGVESTRRHALRKACTRTLKPYVYKRFTAIDRPHFDSYSSIA